MSGNFSARDTSRMLAQRIEALAPKLLPAGVRDGSEWKVGSLAGEPGRSLSINLRGTKAGVWSDFSGGPSGDALDLVAHTLYGGDLGDAFGWALRWLGLNDGSEVKPVSRSVPVLKASALSADSSDAARRLWQEAIGAGGTIVETYLKSRGLALPEAKCIKFHPSCPHGPGQRFPVMLSLMTDPITNESSGVHRTPLLPDGSGRPEGVDKKMLGHAGVIRLSDDTEVTRGLGIAEGVETGLSIMQHADWRPIWAVCSAGGIDRFPILAGIESLTIFADHDEIKPNGKQPGTDAARACFKRWAASGRETRIIHPRRLGDWNDIAKEAAA